MNVCQPAPRYDQAAIWCSGEFGNAARGFSAVADHDRRDLDAKRWRNGLRGAQEFEMGRRVGIHQHRCPGDELTLAALETGVPVVFGVLTVNTTEQALERAAINGMNKGGEALETALEMISLFQRLEQRV